MCYFDHQNKTFLSFVLHHSSKCSLEKKHSNVIKMNNKAGICKCPLSVFFLGLSGFLNSKIVTKKY